MPAAAQNVEFIKVKTEELFDNHLSSL